MSLNSLIGAIAAAIAIVGSWLLGANCEGKMFCAAIAIVSSSWFSRRTRSATECATTAALIISLRWLLRIVPEYPVGHHVICGSQAAQNIMSVPLLGWPLQAWLEFEHWMCDPNIEQAASLACFGLCSGLASSQVFSAALENRRWRQSIRRSRPDAQHT